MYLSVFEGLKKDIRFYSISSEKLLDEAIQKGVEKDGTIQSIHEENYRLNQQLHQK